MTATTTIAIGIMIAQLSLAQIQLNNLRVTGVNPIAEAINMPVHNDWLLPETLRSIASSTALKFGLNASQFVAVVDCESSFVYNQRGDNGLARGLVQIRSDKWPDITDVQADDPLFAFNFMAQKWKEKHSAYWTCARKLGVS